MQDRLEPLSSPILLVAALPNTIPEHIMRVEKFLHAGQGYRVLALAEGRLHSQEAECVFEEHHIPALTLVGLVGSVDPLRPEVEGAVKECRDAGVTVATVTGDHPATALAVSRELGIAESESEVVTGKFRDGRREGKEPVVAPDGVSGKCPCVQLPV